MPEVFYEINGEFICAECVENVYMRYTDDYITGLEEDGTFKDD